MIIHKTMRMPSSCTMCWISNTCDVWTSETCKQNGYDKRLDNCPLEEVKTGMPTVDAVQVIRCQNCRHAIISAQMEHDDGSTTDYYLCELWHRPTEAEGFCHRAEGRSDDD